VLGLVLGVCSYYGSHIVKHTFGVDDVLEVSVIHGFTGALGAIAVGVAADPKSNPGLVNPGLIHGHGKLLGLQVCGQAEVCCVVLCCVVLYAIELYFKCTRLCTEVLHECCLCSQRICTICHHS
jgi:ammonia channel protein AmtB